MKRLTNAEKAEIHKELEEAEKAKFKPYEKRIAELEAEVKEWKDKADLWCKTANLKDHNIMINKDLEKENAELKEQNRNLLESCEGATIMYEHLTKAKELLTRFVMSSVYFNGKEADLVEEAEQFLKE